VVVLSDERAFGPSSVSGGHSKQQRTRRRLDLPRDSDRALDALA
jgi:hypothetical protein